MFVVVDFLAAVALIQAAIIARSSIEHRKPATPTFGQYAVTIQWPKDLDDVDLYVRDPQGQTCYFNALSVDGMHLEHDDLAVNGSGYGGGQNFERVVLREAAPGEYIVNVHLYQRRDSAKIPVTATLWRLRGSDSPIVERVVDMRGQGDEQTAFRFELGGGGEYKGFNRLPTTLLG